MANQTKNLYLVNFILSKTTNNKLTQKTKNKTFIDLFAYLYILCIIVTILTI